MNGSKWVAPGAIVFLILWVAFLAAGRTGFFQDPGTFWHTVVGERILAVGFFDTDPFTFTFAGSHWIPHQWLGEISMALAHRLAGLDTLLLATATILAATFAWPASRLVQTGLHPIAAGLFLFAAVAAGSSHFHVRPHLATISGLLVTMMLLTDLDAGRLHWRGLFWLVPVYLVWSNCHGGMLGGLVTMALAASGWTLAWAIGWPSPVKAWRHVGILALLGFACASTAFLNPYGLDLPRTWFAIMDSPALPLIIQEHSRLDPADPLAWPVIAFTALYLFVLAGTLGSKPQVAWLLPLFWMVQSYGRVRHAPLFAVSGLVAIAAMWPHTRWAAWLAKHRPDFQTPLEREGPPPTRWRANLALPTLVVAIALGIQAAKLPVPLVGAGWVVLDGKKWPGEMLATLKEHEPRSMTRNRLFNDYIDGGYVIYHAPGYRVFVDDRCELFGDQWLIEFLLAAETDTAAAVQKWQERYGQFDFALTRIGSGFEDYFAANPKEWTCVSRGKVAAFYVRK